MAFPEPDPRPGPLPDLRNPFPWRRLIAAFAILAALALLGVLKIVRIDACSQITILDYLRGRYLTPPPGSAQVTFLGVTTLLIVNGSNAVLVDGYFTRPDGDLAPGDLAVSPVPATVESALSGLGIKTQGAPSGPLTLAGVVVNHSHYDHALDSAEVAKRTGALLAGSQTTLNIARASSVPEERLRLFNADGETKGCLGPFSYTAVHTGHLSTIFGIPYPGEITTPTIPTTVSGYLEGGTYALFFNFSSGKRLMVQGSAGRKTDALKDYRADVVFLAVGGLNSGLGQTRSDIVWNETVGMVHPARVYPIHWDPLGGPLTDTPTAVGQAGLDFAQARATAAGIELRKPLVGASFDAFGP